MARPEDTRSASPVDSSYSSSKRSRRDDDRYDKTHRDEGRNQRRRSRTGSPDRRYQDRESRHHRDRSRDRRKEDDAHRSSRKDRSRERHKSRDRDSVKDYRRRSRDRGGRLHRDDSRDRAKRRRGDSNDTRQRHRRDDSPERYHKPAATHRREEPSKRFKTDEEVKAERLAKVEAFKQKHAAEKERRLKEVDSAGGTRKLLVEMEKKSSFRPSIKGGNLLAEDDKTESIRPGLKGGFIDSLPSDPGIQSPKSPSASSELSNDPLEMYMTGLDTSTSPGTDPSEIRPEPLSEIDVVESSTQLDLAPDDFLDIKKKKKELPPVIHSEVAYEPFRKHFYHEPSEISEMTDQEVVDIRMELDGIKANGTDVPRPIQSWSQLGLDSRTFNVISSLGYQKPSPIQAQAIPSLMSGRDVIGVAKTGSGKTIAFLLPLFRHVVDAINTRPFKAGDGPIALILAPTRELAVQIHKECRPFCRALDLRASCVYGGAQIKDQIADCKRGSEIIVATPGRLIDIMLANSGRVTNLRRVTFLVLDEADRLHDMGFFSQMTKIADMVRPDRQTCLFSATFPKKMETLARRTLSSPVEIVVGDRSVVPSSVTQRVEIRPESAKFLRLLELLGVFFGQDESARCLVFVERQESADKLLKDLLQKGYPCMSLHGGKDQIDRDSTIQDFKSGVFQTLIATSIAARGLDVPDLKLVVNYDAPHHLEDYVHRAGRTGRAGNVGEAITFLTDEEGHHAVNIAKALKSSDSEVPGDLQKLVDQFYERVKGGLEYGKFDGYGGKGLERLDEERNAALARERKSHRTGDEPDEDEEENKDKDDKVDDLVAKAASSVKSAAAPPASLPGVLQGIEDRQIVVHKGAAEDKNPLDRVGRAVANIHERLSKSKELRSGMPIDNKGPDSGLFHATLEVNSYGQKARWAVTNRTNIARVLELTQTSITTKGCYYGPGKEPESGGEPPLYILVEGDTEVAVTNAMRELMRLLKEGIIAAAESDARAPASGRYNVV